MAYPPLVSATRSSRTGSASGFVSGTFFPEAAAFSRAKRFLSARAARSRAALASASARAISSAICFSIWRFKASACCFFFFRSACNCFCFWFNCCTSSFWLDSSVWSLRLSSSRAPNKAFFSARVFSSSFCLPAISFCLPIISDACFFCQSAYSRR